MGKFSKYVNTEALRQERYVKRITMAKMAELLGKKSESSYSNLENGVVEPRISDINMVSEILNKPANIFFNVKVQDACTETN